MNIYMIKTGSRYILYYNPPKKEIEEEEKKPCIDLAYKINRMEGLWAGNTTKEFRIMADLNEEINAAYQDVSHNAKKGLGKIGGKIRTRTSGILKDAAYAEKASLNYSENISEDEAKRFFSQIVKREMIKSGIILGIETISFAAFYVPPLIFVPFTSFILGPAIGFQIAIIRALRKGIKNISFVPNPEVSKLERIICGEKGLELANPDLIEYRVAKDL